MKGRVLGLGRPIITVVQPAQSLLGKHATRVYAASSAPRRSPVQPQVRAVFVMVGNILAEQPLPMAFIDRNNVIQQVAAAAADPALGHSIFAKDNRRQSARGGCSWSESRPALRCHCASRKPRSV